MSSYQRRLRTLSIDYLAAALFPLVLTQGMRAVGQDAVVSKAPRAESAIALLQSKCAQCHGEQKQESGLSLHGAAAVLRGGESGPAVVAGKPDESLLYQRIASGEMPPDEGQRLSVEELALVRNWIERGDLNASTDDEGAGKEEFARRSQHWSFQPLKRPEIPPSGAAPLEAAPLNPIDAFVLARLDSAGLPAAPLADRRQLIRRVCFDLLGLPPAPERVDRFVDDPDPQAYEKLIDELLASPQYGERWGRHWLDVARYADTGGYETDIYFKNAWRYRDYVVKSFNDDKPYDRFVQEQVAGDELWPDNLELAGTYQMPAEKARHLEARIGTGFYALGPEIHESNMDAAKLRNERLTDWVDSTGAAFLGLTIGCARCHDHKFDPLSQQDYYGLQAAFASSRVIDVPVVNGMEIADQKQYYPTILAADEARRAFRLFEQSLAGRQPTVMEEQRRQELLAAIGRAVLAIPERGGSTPNTPFDGLLEVPTASILGPELPELVPPIHVLSRGDLGRSKQRATPSLPVVLAEKTNSPSALPSGSGSRKALALWLTAPSHPLTARVMVNRIWAWHFGRGLVATPNDFGHMGQAPSHPELLDWLASEFVNRKWSIKSMHRLIMLSRTYQQSSAFSSDRHQTLDPDNRLLWRMNRRRLEGEEIWDALHAIAGTLNVSMGGRPVMPPLAPEELTDKAAWVVNADPQQHARRGVYVVVRRNFRFPLFDTFDAPVNAVSCAGRDCSTVAPQALWLLNNALADRQSQELAARVIRETGRQPSDWVVRVWQFTLQRPPTPEESREALALLDRLTTAIEPAVPATGQSVQPQTIPAAQVEALEQLCLALFNLNEFLYVD